MTLTRTIHAPRELVWEVWTNEKHLQHWWGPKGFTNPVCDWKVKEGNKLLVHMKGPDGMVYPMDGQFIEVKKPERLVFISAALDGNGQRLFEVMNTVTFTEKDGDTEIVLHASVSNIRSEGAHYLEGMNAGWNQSIDKLERYSTSENRELIIERVLNAPQQLVWDAWTQAGHLAKWYGPNGFTITTHSIDLSEGGVWKYVMHGPDGRDYANKIEFLEVVKPEKLVYKHSDDDPNLEPVSFSTTVTFEKMGQQTKVTMHSVFGSAEELINVSRVYNAVEGGHQTIGRLQVLVEGMA